jgi:hypothetical protein
MIRFILEVRDIKGQESAKRALEIALPPGAQSLVERPARRWKIDARRAPAFDFAAAHPA